MPPTEVANAYFASVRARDIESFLALFSDNAVMTFPDGRSVSGKAEIREAEMRVFQSGNPPTPNPVAMIASENAIAVELQIALKDGVTRKMANFFHLDKDGRIERLRVYRQD